MTEQPLVSVIMPAYNAAPYIVEAIRSVLSQDYANVELIVVDDGSSDRTHEEAKCFGSAVRVLRQENAGPAAARNWAISIARGELIAFLDADDLWTPGKLKAQVDYLTRNAEAGIVYGDFLRWNPAASGSFGTPPSVNERPPESEIVSELSGWIYPQLLLDSVLWIVTALIRKSVFEDVGPFDESLRTGEEYAFWLDAATKYRADKLNRVLAYYRIHPRSTTHMPHAQNNGYRVVLSALQRHGCAWPDGRKLSRRLVRKRLHQLCFDYGYMHYWQGDMRTAEENFRLAAQYAPLGLKTWAYRLLSMIAVQKADARPSRKEAHRGRPS